LQRSDASGAAGKGHLDPQDVGRFVRLDDEIVGVHCEFQRVLAGGDAGDIDPLAVEKGAVYIAPAGLDALGVTLFVIPNLSDSMLIGYSRGRFRISDAVQRG